MPKGAPDYLETVEVTFPSGRTAEEICPTEIAVPVWCAHMGTLTFHPWPVRRADVDHPDELRIDLDPQPGTSFTDAVRVAGVARELLEELGLVGFPKTSGNRGVHIYVRIEPRWEFTDLRHAAIGFGRELARRDDGVTMDWWKEERGERIFVDFNQNNRDRTIASAYSLRPIPGAPVSTPMTWDELAGAHRPARVQPLHRARPDGRRRPVGGDRRHGVLARAAAAALGGAARRRAELPAGLPQDARRAAAGAAVQEGRVALGRGRQPDRGHVTEDNRVGRNPGEPAKDGAAGSARWAAYLDWVREEIDRRRAGAVAGRAAHDAGCRRGGRRSSCSRHVLHMEQRWFVWGFLGEPVAEPWGDWTVDEPWDEDAEGRWHVAPTTSRAEELAERLRAIGERTRAVLRDFPLDATASPGGRFADDPPTLEWICFHVLAEYARHAGHLDIVVELGQK